MDASKGVDNHIKLIEEAFDLQEERDETTMGYFHAQNPKCRLCGRIPHLLVSLFMDRQMTQYGTETVKPCYAAAWVVCECGKSGVYIDNRRMANASGCDRRYLMPRERYAIKLAQSFKTDAW